MDPAAWCGSGGSAPDPRDLSLRAFGLGSWSPGYHDLLANLRRSSCFPAEPYPPKGWPDSSADGPGNGDFSRPTEEGFKLSSGTQNGVWTVVVILGQKLNFGKMLILLEQIANRLRKKQRYIGIIIKFNSKCFFRITKHVLWI